jgi:hypothetical protein
MHRATMVLIPVTESPAREISDTLVVYQKLHLSDIHAVLHSFEKCMLSKMNT